MPSAGLVRHVNKDVVPQGEGGINPTARAPRGEGGGDSSVLDANYHPQLTVGRRPPRGGGGIG